MAAEFEEMFELARKDHGLPYDQRLIVDHTVASTIDLTMGGRSDAVVVDPRPPVSASLATPVPVGATTLAEVYQRFIDDPTKRRSARTMLAHETTRRVVTEVLGEGIAISEIGREHCRDLLEVLRWLPVNSAKHYPKLTVREASAKAKQDTKIKTINATNLNAYMARFVTMLNWAVGEEFIARNPAKGLRIADPVRPQDRRKPFATWQLQKIFSAPIYTGCLDEGAGYAKRGAHIATGARFWVPLIGLFSGMRLNEICQLDVADVRQIEGIACFVVASESMAGTTDKSLKNRSSARIVPVHPTLLEIGLWAFVTHKKSSSAVKLFDDIPLGAKGFRSVAFSRWFSRFLHSAKAEAPQTCFHSFRHVFRDATRNAKIDRHVALTLGGWTTGGGHSEAADAYGAGYSAKALYEAICLIKFDDLDLRRIGYRRGLNSIAATAVEVS